MFTVVAPAAIATSTTWARNSSSVREASSGENSTSAHSSRARPTPAAASRRISSCAMLSLYWRWMALGGGERSGRQLDVLIVTARERAHDRTLNLARHGRDALEVPARRRREAGLDDIDTKLGERACHPQFLRSGH